MLKLNKPIPPSIKEHLKCVDEVARDLRLEYFLSGAMARVLILFNVYGLNTGRRTEDLDMAISVESWEVFFAFKGELKKRYGFVDGHQAHRLIYEIENQEKAWLDLIPFGEIESGDSIAWPPDERRMNMLGFKEALASAELIDCDDGMIVRTASLSSQAVLKLIAWKDRRHRNTKDAADLIYLCKNYHQAGTEDRLFDEAFDILEKSGYDQEAAGAQLLGMDAAKGCRPGTKAYIQDIFNAEDLMQALDDQTSSSLPGDDEARRAMSRKLLDGFIAGFSR